MSLTIRVLVEAHASGVGVRWVKHVVLWSLSLGHGEVVGGRANLIVLSQSLAVHLVK